MKKNERKRTAYVDCYIFRGLIRCKECDYMMCGKLQKHSAETSRYYYICKTHHLKKKCNCKKNFNEYIIEKNLVENIDKYISEYIHNSEVKVKEAKVIDNEKEKKQINKQLEKLRDLYLRDMIQIEHYEKQYKELTSKLEHINSIKIEKPKKQNTKELKKILNSDFKLKYFQFTRAERRRIWTSIIDTIYIDEDYNMNIIFI